MAILDLNDPISLMRLRTGDTRDIPVLPDEVYQKTLDDNSGNIKVSSIICAQYILATLAFKGQQRMGIVEVYGQHVFRQYQDYLMMIVKNPDFSGISPIPYSHEGTSPITKFQKNWDEQYDCYKYIGEL